MELSHEHTSHPFDTWLLICLCPIHLKWHEQYIIHVFKPCSGINLAFKSNLHYAYYLWTFVLDEWEVHSYARIFSLPFLPFLGFVGSSFQLDYVGLILGCLCWLWSLNRSRCDFGVMCSWLPFHHRWDSSGSNSKNKKTPHRCYYWHEFELFGPPLFKSPLYTREVYLPTLR